MSYSMNVQNGVSLDLWLEMLKKMESKDEPRAIYIRESRRGVGSYDLLSASELQSTLAKPEVYSQLESHPDWRYRRLQQGYIVYYKMPFVEITRINEEMIKGLHKNHETPAHLTAVKENIVKNVKDGHSLINALKADLIRHDTILNSQLRMHTSAVKNRCCIIRIICYIQDFFAKLWSDTLSGFFRYTVFLPMINVDVWNSRYSIETFRRARKDFAQAIIGQFEEEAISLIGKDVTIKQWIARNHPDKNGQVEETYLKVDGLRQTIQELKEYVASMDDPSIVKEPAPQEEAFDPATGNPVPQEEVASPAAAYVMPNSELPSVEQPD